MEASYIILTRFFPSVRKRLGSAQSDVFERKPQILFQSLETPEKIRGEVSVDRVDAEIVDVRLLVLVNEVGEMGMADGGDMALDPAVVPGGYDLALRLIERRSQLQPGVPANSRVDM